MATIPNWLKAPDFVTAVKQMALVTHTNPTDWGNIYCTIVEGIR
jgi:hypothetical protein